MSKTSEQALESVVTESKPVKKKRHVLGKIVFVLILAGIVAVGYYYFRYHHHAYKVTQVNNAQLAQHNQVQIQQLLQQQQQILNQQDQIFAQLQQHGLSGHPLALANVIFLLRRAELQLQIEHDPQGAIDLLNIASADLQRLNSHQFDAVQQAIATDINILHAIKLPNVNQLAQYFAHLSQQVSQLSLALTQQNLQKPIHASSLQGWRKIVDDAWQSVRDVIIVERTDTSFKPLMSQQDLFSFKQYLQNLLQQTLWAVLKQNDVIYHSSLTQLQNALSANVAKTDTDALQLQQELATLQAMSVQAAMPKQLSSLRVAQATQHRLLMAQPGKVA